MGPCTLGPKNKSANLLEFVLRLDIHEEYSNNRANLAIYIVFQIMVRIYQALIAYCNTTQGIYVHEESKELCALQKRRAASTQQIKISTVGSAIFFALYLQGQCKGREQLNVVFVVDVILKIGIFRITV